MSVAGGERQVYEFLFALLERLQGVQVFLYHYSLLALTCFAG